MTPTRMNCLAHMPGKYIVGWRWCPLNNESWKPSLTVPRAGKVMSTTTEDRQAHNWPRGGPTNMYSQWSPPGGMKEFNKPRQTELPQLAVTQDNSVFTPFYNLRDYLKYVVKIRMWICLDKLYERDFPHLPVLFLCLIQFTQDNLSIGAMRNPKRSFRNQTRSVETVFCRRCEIILQRNKNPIGDMK